MSTGEKRQIIDFPEIIIPFIKEFIELKAECKCGHKMRSEFPAEVTGTVCFGPVVEATIGYLSTRQDIPFKRLSELMSILFGLDMSQGTIAKILNRMRKKAQLPYEKIRHVVEQSTVVGCDETSASVNGKNEWLWAFQTDMAVYLTMNDGRGKADIDLHFTDGFPNATLVTDILAAYFNVIAKDRQICLAHLLRNTIYIQEFF